MSNRTKKRMLEVAKRVDVPFGFKVEVRRRVMPFSQTALAYSTSQYEIVVSPLTAKEEKEFAERVYRRQP